MENIEAIETHQPLTPLANDLIGPSPDNPPWGSWAAFGVWVASIALVIICPLIFVIPYLAATGILSQREQFEAAVKTDPIAVLLQIIGIIPAHLLTLALAWFVVTRGRKFSFKEMLGWDWNGFRVYHAVLISIGFYGLAIVAVLIFGDVENEFDIMLKSSRYIVYVVAFFAIVTAPIVEEVVYRGLMYSAFQRTLGKVAAVLLVTLLFALVHGAQYSVGGRPDYAVMSVLLLLSLTLTVIRAKSGNLLPCIVLHVVFNSIQSVLLIAEPFLRPYIENAEQTVGLIAK